MCRKFPKFGETARSVLACLWIGQWPYLKFELALEQTAALRVHGHCRSWNREMLTILAILAAPILITTIVTIFVFEIKDAWDRNRLR